MLKPLPADFETLALKLAIGNYDIMLVGDGSGATPTFPCGFACFAYQPGLGEVKTFYGGTNGGTNNFAELVPYIHALWYYDKCLEGMSSSNNVVIISDSEVTVRCGQGRYERRQNLPLWASIDWFVSHGWQINWYHQPRNSNPILFEADRLAGRFRSSILKFDHERSSPGV